jgi:hypothetical protein
MASTRPTKIRESRSASEIAVVMLLEIFADVRSGRVPRTVRSFAELHDHVDANDYGMNNPSTEAEFAKMNTAQGLVDQWLKSNPPGGGR